MMYLHWESHLVQKVDLRNAPPMTDYMGMMVTVLRDLHWENYFGAGDGDDIGSSNEMLDGNIYGKLEDYPMGE